VPRSHSIYGCSEGFVKSKKQVIPAAVINPYFAVGMLAVYVADGRFSPPKHPEPLPLEPARAEPVTTASVSVPDREKLPVSTRRSFHTPVAQE
jgi:hypothetical protein